MFKLEQLLTISGMFGHNPRKLRLSQLSHKPENDITMFPASKTKAAQIIVRIEIHARFALPHRLATNCSYLLIADHIKHVTKIFYKRFVANVLCSHNTS